MVGGGVSGIRKLHLGLTYNSTVASSTSNALPPDFFAEWDAPATIDSLREALELRYDVTPVEADEDAYEKLRRARPDLVFNFAEGIHGSSREGFIPSILDLLQIPYTGSNATTLNLCLHKARTKEVLAYHGVPVTPHMIVSEPPAEIPFPFPAIVKPLHEGSGKGIRNTSLVRSRKELGDEVARIAKDYAEVSIVEPFLPGREFTVAVLGNSPDVQILPPVEIRFDALPSEANPLYSYEAKWIWDVPEKPLEIFHCPAKIETTLLRQIEEICRRTVEVLECRDWGRIDLRLDAQGVPHVLEVNPIPGILPHPEENSCFPKAARAAGLDYVALVHRVVEHAGARLRIPLMEEAASPISR